MLSKFRQVRREQSFGAIYALVVLHDVPGQSFKIAVFFTVSPKMLMMPMDSQSQQLRGRQGLSVLARLPAYPAVLF